MLWEKSKNKLKTKAKKIPDVCSVQDQSSNSSNKEQYSDVCSNKEQVFTKCSKKKWDKNCQTDKDTHVQPVQWAMKNDMWSVTSSSNRKSIEQSSSKPKNSRIQQYVCDDKNCQSNKLYKKRKSDKNCQDNRNVIWPVNPQMDMWSKEPAMQSSQSTRCYKKYEDTKYDNELSRNPIVFICGQRSHVKSESEETYFHFICSQ